jgi:hypothetical protein
MDGPDKTPEWMLLLENKKKKVSKALKNSEAVYAVQLITWLRPRLRGQHFLSSNV